MIVDLDDVVTANSGDGLTHVVNVVDGLSSSVWTECGIAGYDRNFAKVDGPATCFLCSLAMPYEYVRSGERRARKSR